MGHAITLAMSEKPEAAIASPEAPRGALAAIFLIILVDFLGFGLIIPLLPFYVPDYEDNPMKVTMIFSIFSICQFIGAPVLGALSDRYGRRPVLILSRRLDDAQGAFDGLIVVAIEPAYLTSIADYTGLGKGDFMAARRADGIFLAARMIAVAPTAGPVLREDPVLAAPAGLEKMPGSRFVDGRARYVGWHHARNYPMVGLVGMRRWLIFRTGVYTCGRRVGVFRRSSSSLFLLFFGC